MNYGDNTTYLTQYAGDGGYATDPDFMAQLPIFIRSAELRILRDLELLTAKITDTTASLTPNNRLFTLPEAKGTYQVVDTVQIKKSYNNDITGTLFAAPPMLWVSKEWLDATYPSDYAVGAPSIPRYIAPYNDTQYAVGPAPGVAYPLIVYGSIWPETLSATNNETWISQNLPDLMLAAEMLDVSMWLRQFGRSADEAQQSMDWNAEYERLKGQANVVNLRQQVSSTGYGIKAPNPIAKAS